MDGVAVAQHGGGGGNLVLILDYGSQYTRRIRQLSVLSLCVSGTSSTPSDDPFFDDHTSPETLGPCYSPFKNFDDYAPPEPVGPRCSPFKNHRSPGSNCSSNDVSVESETSEFPYDLPTFEDRFSDLPKSLGWRMLQSCKQIMEQYLREAIKEIKGQTMDTIAPEDVVVYADVLAAAEVVGVDTKEMRKQLRVFLGVAEEETTAQ